MDLHSPTSPLAQGHSPTRRTHSQTYATQVRAFIEAAEVVDADPDTIEDLLDGLDADAVFTDDTSEREVSTLELESDDELEALLQEGVCPPRVRDGVCVSPCVAARTHRCIHADAIVRHANRT